MTGTEVICRDLATGDSESMTIVDDHVVVVDGRAFISSVVAYANGTQIITIKRAATADEARSTPAQITRHFGRSA
jgi:hypothetical protein